MSGPLHFGVLVERRYLSQAQPSGLIEALGARGHSALRRFLGSVSSRVVAEAGCSVTVVRPPRDNELTAAD